MTYSNPSAPTSIDVDWHLALSACQSLNTNDEEPLTPFLTLKIHKNWFYLLKKQSCRALRIPTTMFESL